MRSTPGALTSFAAGVALLLLLPAVSFAQSSIAGVVKDDTGAVLPGVTVEAASPALIERTRVVVSDEQGQFKIVDLRPGVYAVTFSLQGFSTFKRDGITLQASTVATVNGEMKVGALEETITVSGATPMVDVQQASRTQVLTRDIIDTLPSTRNNASHQERMDERTKGKRGAGTGGKPRPGNRDVDPKRSDRWE